MERTHTRTHTDSGKKCGLLLLFFAAVSFIVIIAISLCMLYGTFSFLPFIFIKLESFILVFSPGGKSLMLVD